MTGAGGINTTDGADRAGAPRPRIDRLVLLAGAVRPGELIRGSGRVVLDLPISDERSVLGAWCEQATRLASLAGLDRLEIEVVLDPSGAAPAPVATDERVGLRVRRDETSYRGTGGALRDIARDMGAEGTLVVANAGQILTMGLEAIVDRLASARADVALVAHDDGTPSGVMLLATRTLQQVNPVGFVDFKEQVLPTLTDTFDIRAVRFDRATGRPIRTLETYVAALREHHEAMRDGGGALDPFAERWAPTFAVTEPGAEVAASARLHDSVVLAGARVEADAVVVRSVVGPQGRVGRGQIVVDSVVSGAARRGLGRSA